MKKNNKYGFVSGGYLFDIMDRCALDEITKHYGDWCYYFTKKARIYYKKQCCSTKNIECRINQLNSVGDEFFVFAAIVNKKDQTLYATAEFIFVRKTNNYCENK